eukprot:5124244-Pyramimonas_sp.AAC.1
MYLGRQRVEAQRWRAQRRTRKTHCARATHRKRSPPQCLPDTFAKRGGPIAVPTSLLRAPARSNEDACWAGTLETKRFRPHDDGQRLLVAAGERANH